MFFDERIETMPRETLQALQLERLQRQVRYNYEHIPFYKERLDECGVGPDGIHSLDDLRKIPFTVKNDLREHYPYGLFAVPMKDVVRIQGSTGTTGRPTIVGYTRKDVDTWSQLTARLAMAVGVNCEDVVQVAFGYGLFTGALGMHAAVERIGCTVIPLSSGNTERQIMIMRDLGTTVLIATPSYALYLAETMERMGLDPKADTKLRIGLFGGEATSPMMQEELRRRMGILATDNYGLSELFGPGIAGECECQCGMHYAEDHFIAEVIDPETGEVLPEGELGELVLTNLTREACPVLRYRTRDMTRIHYEKCACGRTHARMEKLHGRSDDMLVIRGVNVFPSQVELVLARVPEVGPNYEIVVSRQGALDQMEVQMELIDGTLLENFALLEALEQRIHGHMKSVLGLDVKVKLVEPYTLKRFEGKARRVTDLRKIYGSQEAKQ